MLVLDSTSLSGRPSQYPGMRVIDWCLRCEEGIGDVSGVQVGRMEKLERHGGFA